VRYIYELAEKIHFYNKNEDQLINYVNSLDREYLEELNNRYQKKKKVNYINYIILKIIKKLLNNEKIDEHFIENMKLEAIQMFDDNKLGQWKIFNILLPFFYENYTDKTNIELSNLYDRIKALDIFKSYKFKEKSFISDFYGPYKYGRTKCKIVLYPDGKDSHRKAAQLLLQIGYDGKENINQIIYGLCIGDELKKINNDLRDDLDFVNSSEDFDFKKLKQKFIDVFERFKEINANTPDTSQIDEKTVQIFNSIDVDNETEENNLMVNFDIDLQIEDLIFEQDEILKDQITTALRCGKHIILVGPPGTGKSKLAKIICDNYNIEYMMATATSDWSTYDTIGGYKPDTDGHLYFDPGLFLQLFKDRETKQQTNKWLIIDEINRADIDKAFGSIFSALTGDTITLHFKAENGKNIIIKPEIFNDNSQPADNEYIIPTDWRIIGTMNTFDKTSLYEMSYAFMRRFAFVPIKVPSNINKDLINKYLKIWKIEDKVFNEINIADGLTELWNIINKYRIIGPAIIEDIARYVSIEGDYTSAIIMYALPQFEGLSTDNLNNFLQDLNNSHIKNLSQRQEMMINFVNDYFNI
jgi:MoxR-like ATPase